MSLGWKEKMYTVIILFIQVDWKIHSSRNSLKFNKLLSNFMQYLVQIDECTFKTNEIYCKGLMPSFVSVKMHGFHHPISYQTMTENSLN
jgi:hypothetical protein